MFNRLFHLLHLGLIESSNEPLRMSYIEEKGLPTIQRVRTRVACLERAALASHTDVTATLDGMLQSSSIVTRKQVALTLVDIPITFLTTSIFGNLIYFIVGLQTSPGQFFIFYLFLFTMSITMEAWFRSIAAIFKSEATAQAVSGIVLLAMVIYTILPSLLLYSTGAYDVFHPLRYGFKGILANEFHTLNGKCSSLVPQGPGYEGYVQRLEVNGNRFIKLSYDYSYSNVWMNFGIVVAFGVAFVVALLIFSEFNTSVSGETFLVLFKRGAKSPVLKEAFETGSVDEEKSSTSTGTRGRHVPVSGG
ncbi:hypothetical protein D9615_007886 [Tricholomella constricta]|uniref:ABC-2 type transporter domain-containing protein n=1 Tax=Tricholomella constricta TaxID=117010 RepID=A0A8H5H4Q8_9AGAR|nr:hypothetical protein D9615_007886 [Tricholomella constricta]